MHIGVDGYNLALPNGTGVATYGYTLVRTLATLGCRIDGIFGIDPGDDATIAETQFFDRLARPSRGPRRWRRIAGTLRTLRPVRVQEVPLTDAVDRADVAERLPQFDRIWTSADLFDRAHRMFAATGRFTDVVSPDPPNIMHWTYPVPLQMRGARNIYTLHDLVPLTLPGATLDDKRRYHRLVSACARCGDAIATVSEASRSDIVRLLGVDPAKVVCTWQVSPSRFAMDDLIASSARQFGLDDRGYFLFFGAVEPKKNVGRLLEAYLSLDTATPLVMVSGRGWQTDQALYLLPQDDNPGDPRHESLASRVIRMPYLPRRVLASLIASARAVLFPSLAEGFGLPAHEAMLLGTPVLASNVGALAEIVGDAGVLVDPTSVPAIRDGIAALDRDEALRTRLAYAGRKHAERYSVESYGRALTALYEMVLHT